MKYRILAMFLLVIAAACIAGCTQGPAPAATPVPTAAVTQASATAAPVATFSLGEQYLPHKKYSFNSEKDVFTEGPFRVTNDPWAIDFTVNPMSTDPKSTWFEITATNIDTGRSETFGYGRTHPLEKHQQIPMYNEGPYKFDMKGNLVSVDVVVAKRNP
jgi:hypothetical protein